jgi:arabinose-5-phosphate isomerase
MKFDKVWLDEKIKITITEIEGLCSHISLNTFNKFAQKIAENERPLYLIGVGSSSNIAKKAAHSLSTVGITAVAPDLLDLLHGSIGGIKKNSLILLISKSGRTPEIITFLKYRETFADEIFFLTESDATIPFVPSDQIIRLPPSNESDLTGVLPTVSFIKMSILIDLFLTALQIIQMNKGSEIRIFHPAGELGKLSRMTIGDLAATLNLRPAVKIDANLKECLEAISQSGVGGVAVVDSDLYLIGVISDGDIRRAVILNEGLKTTDSIGQFIQSSPEILTTEITLIQARVRIQSSTKRAFYPIANAEGKFRGTISSDEVFSGPSMEEF